jgi:uncharacterized membrane-anchored protein
VNSVASPRAELFYWVTITFSQTLGTALGDWTADSFGETTFMGLDSGYALGALIFAGARHCRRALPFHLDAALRVVLGSLHPDPAARRDVRGFP